MLHKTNSRFDSSNHTFNLIAVIDVVFLLIIFFLVVCRFIEAENFEVSVTDNCEFAEVKEDTQTQMATVTVMKNEDGKIDFAVGPDKITVFSNTGFQPVLTRTRCPCYNEVVAKIAQSIDSYLLNLPSDDRVVILRIDKDVCFADAQCALAGVAKSRAANIQLAVLKEKRLNPE